MVLILACYFPAEEPCFMSVRIDADDYVYQLKTRILEEFKRRGHFVPRREIRIYQTNVELMPAITRHQRSLEWLHLQSKAANLDDGTVIKRVFPGTLPKGIIHILVANLEVFELLDGLSDPDAPYKRELQKDLLKRLASAESVPAPSDVVKTAAKVRDFLQDREVCMDGVPVAMFSPVLAKLQQRLENLEHSDLDPIPFQLDSADMYLRGAVSFYDNEDLAYVRVKGDFLIGDRGDWMKNLAWAGDIKPEGSWWKNSYVVALLELKNMVGLAGDALLQAVADYSKILSAERFKSLLRKGTCNFPVILVGITANRLQVSAAVCVGPIYVSHFITLDLSTGFHASSQIDRVARVFNALSLSRTELNKFYTRFVTPTNTHPDLSALYPNPTVAPGIPPPPALTYSGFMDRAGRRTTSIPNLGNATTAMYLATLNNSGNKKVVVKFTARYGKEAHALLAAAKYAPELHFCERIVGGLYMVVMDHIDGKSIWQLRKDRIPIAASVYVQVEQAISLLHQADLVFGDVRDSNILCVDSGDSEMSRVVLVDFDRAAKDGEGRYPATLNRANPGADGVGPFTVMKKAHDEWQIEQLKLYA